MSTSADGKVGMGYEISFKEIVAIRIPGLGIAGISVWLSDRRSGLLADSEQQKR
jgi:hypothetical protein